MKIALDAMGGDNAPAVVIEGALIAKQDLPSDVQIVLIGDKPVVEKTLLSQGASIDAFDIVHASEVIGMSEHPAKAVASKQDSSIVVGYKLLMAGEVDVFCSAGNTGAMLVAAMFTIKTIPGVLRPGIAGFIPKQSGKYGTVLDVGANAEVKPEVLAQFAHIGSLYVKYMYGIDRPTVGLMNLGEEEEKGTPLLQAAYQLIKSNDKVNFVGNIEGRDILNDKADLIICDGYVGNVILKMAESLYPILSEKGYNDPFIDLFNWEKVGGSPILGVNGNVIIGHGSSTATAICHMVKMSKQLAESGITEKIKNAYS